MNNGQMDRGNENPTQHLPWWLRKTTKKPQSGWSAPGFESGSSRMRISCVTTEPPRSVLSLFCFLLINEGYVLQLKSETVVVHRQMIYDLYSICCPYDNRGRMWPWWLRKTTKKPQSGWSAPGFEPGTSRMRVPCVATEPPRSVRFILLYGRHCVFQVTGKKCFLSNEQLPSQALKM